MIFTEVAFPTSMGPEYATIRSFSFKASAEYPYAGTSNFLLSFHETLTFWGGGPIYCHRLAINGPPQKQMPYPASIYSCRQQGSVVGYQNYPTIPGAKFPFALKESPNISNKSPMRRGRGYQGYQTDYSYMFESAAPLVATPSLWIS